MATASPAKAQLQAVRRAVRDLERAVDRLLRSVSSASGSPPRKLKLSPKRRAALKLHGRYLGYVRQLKRPQKAKVKALRQKKGYRAAIAFARRMAGKL